MKARSSPSLPEAEQPPERSRLTRMELIDALAQSQTALLIAGSDIQISGAIRLPLLEQAHRSEVFLDQVYYAADRAGGNAERVRNAQRSALRRLRLRMAIARADGI